MNREIKFRAWDGLTCKMIQWDGMYGLERCADPPGVGVHIAEGDQCYAMPEDTILMQYTGLKDKNGRDVYEGDLIDCGSGPYPVKWDDLFTGWIVDVANDQYRLDEYIRFGGSVLGNIYENPELCAAPTRSTS